MTIPLNPERLEGTGAPLLFPTAGLARKTVFDTRHKTTARIRDVDDLSLIHISVGFSVYKEILIPDSPVISAQTPSGFLLN